MKTVGIIGGLGPETTSEFYLDVIFTFQKKNNINRAPVIISSVPLPYIIEVESILKNKGVKSCLFAGIYIVEKSFLKRLTAGRIESIVLPLIDMIKENPRSVGGSCQAGADWA